MIIKRFRNGNINIRMESCDLYNRLRDDDIILENLGIQKIGTLLFETGEEIYYVIDYINNTVFDLTEPLCHDISNFINDVFDTYRDKKVLKLKPMTKQESRNVIYSYSNFIPMDGGF